ncbi:L-aspartate oxidase [Actinomadura sp. HBU206391]|uniref:L-aspartate oxidase n=1 Tax=Actinomadura sp. HBU206391 TaxID=2731692 RepID=UPI00164FC5D1|nr:L-aspartate oxidase [Actinomadura sp. HBU206391]MBC6458844.1 L-aspartate oxidase [Actinomadura sp. HBU206391]
MIPRRLSAPDPGWTVDADVVVIGSGIAGLIVALRARAHGRVLLVTKALLDEGSTRWAQGGIAAALAPDDSPGEHLRDTLTAGVGLCDPEAVRTLVTEGPEAVRRLIELGTDFDRTGDGAIALTREGGHHRRRIAHAGGDATGAEISRALLAACKAAGGIDVIEHALVLDLMVSEGRAAGVTLHVMGEGQCDGVGAVRARAVVLATGGLGQVFSATTNPEVSTGDGVALALRAGADAADLEFVQFHPTVLWLGDHARGQQPLISEAVRGEGAHLVDAAGERFMVGRHELAELAPRDVVAKGIMNRMRETGASHVFLDGRHLGERVWERRFPTILASCRHHGVDPVTEPIPVVPAAHYASGGVRTDLWGRTSVPGLYACGEVACTGVHGANRLASNSLLEGLVFAERIGTALGCEPADPASASRATEGSPRAEGGTAARRVPVAGPTARSPLADGGLLEPGVRAEVQRVMTDHSGVLRSAEGLRTAERELTALAGRRCDEPGVAAWEATNLHTVATAIVRAALRREETRGSHWREDFPGLDDAAWQGNLVTRLDGAGLTTAYEPRAVHGSPGGTAADRPRAGERARARAGRTAAGDERGGDRLEETR